MSEGGESVKVMVRCRLFNSREIGISEKRKEPLRSCVKMRDKTCCVVEFVEDSSGFPIEREREAFEFDECFWSMPLEQVVSAMPQAGQQYVYDRSGFLAMQAAMSGYNVCIFAYGQTGSGKTYSMLGGTTDPGISPRLVDDIFSKEKNPTCKVQVECMFFEIYNEKVRDLFNKKSKVGDYDAPKIRLHPTRGVFVEGLARKVVTTAAETKHLIEKGTKERAVSETKMNATSSRSHAIFQIHITANDALKGTQRRSVINLVDLAGSEKIKMSQVTGDALTEAKAINQSLSTLRKVLDTLVDNSHIKNKKHHKLPPFRESVLTYVLSDSLGGNSKTQMIAAISPHESNLEDTLGTLRYALKAKAIVCNATVNEEKSAAMLDAMKEELLLLQQKLREGGSGGGSGEPSVEIQAEIEARETELKEMEETQQQMEVMLADAKVKEEELNQQLKEVDEAKQELSLAVQAQKKDRFAAAFRNAFLLNVEKKKQEASKIEYEEVTSEKNQLAQTNEYLTNELSTVKAAYEEYQNASEERLDQNSKDIAARDQQIIQLKRQVGNMTEEASYSKTQVEALQQRVHSLEANKAEADKRVQRLQEEIMSVNSTLEREQSDAQHGKELFETKISKLHDDIENLRRRKDKYKQQYLQADARAEAQKALVDALQADRGSFLNALKAQQQVVEEQSVSVKRMYSERKDSEEKSKSLQKVVGEKEEDMRCMSEALREYQSAASEWMYENHAINKELERVSKANTDLRQTLERSSSPMMPSYYAGSPGAGGGAASYHADPSMGATSSGLPSQSPTGRNGSLKRQSASPMRRF